MDEIIFLADVHLNPAKGYRTKLFLRFLDDVGRGASAIYILGDLFDYWVGPKQALLPDYGSVLNALKGLSSNGVLLYFLHGNRDFPVSDEIENEYGIKVLGEEHRLKLGGSTVYLSHGDLLWTKDRNYRCYRAIVRDERLVALIRSMPLGLTSTMARWLRRMSERASRRRESRGWRIDLDCVDGYTPIFKSGVDIIVCGHAHQNIRKTFVTDGGEKSLYILGAWEKSGSYASWHDGVMELKTYELSA